MGFINWAWGWVLAPIWIPICIGIIGLLVIFAFSIWALNNTKVNPEEPDLQKMEIQQPSPHAEEVKKLRRRTKKQTKV